VASQTAQLIIYGAIGRSFAVEAAASLELIPAAWTPLGLDTGPMTNTFRFLPAFPTPAARRFFRAEQQ
jgi:hypothetical protein